MFGIKKTDLVRNLEKIRLQRCAYSPASFCDCKYGHKDGNPSIMSETFSGCPEIGMSKRLFEVMTDSEFKRICKRAGISLVV